MAFVAFSPDHERQLQSLLEQKDAATQALLSDVAALPEITASQADYITANGQAVFDVLYKHFSPS